jgi:acyl-CoA thioesterase FadM
LRFEDLVEIHLLVSEKKSKALSYLFHFNRLDPQPVEHVARGRLTVVCVTHRPGGKMAAATIPALIADKIEVAPAELLI